MSEQKPSQLLLAGAYGNIGSAIRAYMKREHPEVAVVPLHPLPFNLSDIKAKLDSGLVKYFINCAGFANNKGSISNPYSCFKTNVDGVVNHLEMVRLYAPDITYVNFGTIYENEPDCQGITPYIASKRAVRDIITAYRDNYKMRCFTATLGLTEYYNRSPEYLIQRVVRWAVDQKGDSGLSGLSEETPFNNIDQLYNLLWAEDLADGLWVEINKKSIGDCRFLGSEMASLWTIIILAYSEAVGISTESIREEFYFDEISDCIPYLQDKCLMPTWNPKTGMRAMIKMLVEAEIKRRDSKTQRAIRPTVA